MAIAWTRHPVLDTGYAHYSSDVGIHVRWCMHPTASFKYWVAMQDGYALDIYGRGGTSTFRTVREAKAAAEEAFAQGAHQGSAT